MRCEAVARRGHLTLSNTQAPAAPESLCSGLSTEPTSSQRHSAMPKLCDDRTKGHYYTQILVLYKYYY